MNIVIATYNRYPNGDAASVRQYVLSKIFTKLGYYVVNVGMGDSTNYKESMYEETRFISLRDKKSNFFSRVNNFFGYGFKLIKYLNKLSTDGRAADFIMIQGVPVYTLILVKMYSKVNNIGLLHDSVEWYSPSQFKLGVFSYTYIKQTIYNKWLINKNFKVIAISKYLESHYKERGIDVIRVPFLLETDRVSLQKKKMEKLVLTYAGSPGRKDYLKEMVEGIAKLSENERNLIEFRIIGINNKQLIEDCGIADDTFKIIEKTLKILGRIDRSRVIANLYESDFTVLLRNSNLRYAKAGFPSKVVESLVHGTPVILNISSDLDDYIFDMKNGLIVENCSSESFMQTIRKALLLTNKQILTMSKISRETAVNCFDINLYINEMDIFMKM